MYSHCIVYLHLCSSIDIHSCMPHFNYTLFFGHFPVRPQLSPVIAELSVNREDPVTLEFEVRQAEPPALRDNITWTAVTSSGQMVLTCDNTTKYNFSSSCLSLTVNNAQRTDGGSYTIEAVTRAGVGSSVISVSVIGG